MFIQTLLVSLVLLLANVVSAATPTCNFCDDAACHFNIWTSLHASGAFAVHLVFNTTQISFANVQPWCYKSSDNMQYVTITCIPDCESHCVSADMEPTLKFASTTRPIPFKFHFNRENKVATVWSSLAAMTCSNCDAFQPPVARGYFCLL